MTTPEQAREALEKLAQAGYASLTHDGSEVERHSATLSSFIEQAQKDALDARRYRASAAAAIGEKQ